MKAEEREIGTAQFRNVLVFSPNWIGDTIMAMPMVAGLRETVPGARMIVVANPRVAALWKTNPYIDQIWDIDTSGIKGWINHVRLLDRIKHGDFDAALILPHDVGVAVVTGLAGVPVRVGADVGGRGIFLTHAPADQARVRHRHMIENYLGLLRMIGLEPGPAELVLPVDHTAQVATDEILAANGVKASDLVIGLAPGATYGPAKRWPKECFAELADRLMTECRAKVMLLLGPQERELGGEIRSLTRQAPLLWERNFPLLEVAALIKRCRVFIANDSGLMHMAAAVGTPVIALFGSTSPVWTSPGGPGHLVLRKPIACSPCFQRRCALNTYECLTSITVLEVLAAVETQLRNRTEADEVAPTAMPR